MTEAEIEFVGIDRWGRNVRISWLYGTWHLLIETEMAMRIIPQSVAEAALSLEGMSEMNLILRGVDGNVLHAGRLSRQHRRTPRRAGIGRLPRVGQLLCKPSSRCL